MEENGSAPVPDSDKFFESRFAQGYAASATIFTQVSELEPALAGLWCWDLIELSGAAPKLAKNTVREARGPRDNREEFGGAQEAQDRKGQPARQCDRYDREKDLDRAVGNQYKILKELVRPAGGIGRA